MAGALIALYSPSYFSSKWCFAELTACVPLVKPVIPLRTGGDVPADIQAIQAIDYAGDRVDGFARLRRALNLIGLSGGDDFAPDRDRSPYPGLAYFEERDASVFFGRSPEVAAALQALQRFADSRRRRLPAHCRRLRLGQIVAAPRGDRCRV